MSPNSPTSPHHLLYISIVAGCSKIMNVRQTQNWRRFNKESSPTSIPTGLLWCWVCREICTWGSKGCYISRTCGSAEVPCRTLACTQETAYMGSLNKNTLLYNMHVRASPLLKMLSQVGSTMFHLGTLVHQEYTITIQ